MSDQLRINTAGELEAEPVTWDDQPLFSPSTVREGLFSTDAFEQMPGQIAFEASDETL
jgi:hypothetical protein